MGSMQHDLDGVQRKFSQFLKPITKEQLNELMKQPKKLEKDLGVDMWALTKVRGYLLAKFEYG